MNVKIGAKIKELRKRDDITQEKLAEVLGLTSQAVSKWESESGYPDIEYITPIANFFNVTIDSLFDHDSAEKLRKIDEYCEQSQRKLPQERIDIMRQALAEFPAEEKLLFILAEALYCKWRFTPKPIKMVDEKCVLDDEKYEGDSNRKESTAIFEELLVSSVDDSIRAQCRWHLAMIYGVTDDKENLMKIAKTCDPVRKSRQMLLAYAIQGHKEREMYRKEALLDLISSFASIFGDLSYSRANRFFDEDIADEIRFEGEDIIIDLYTKINKFVFNEQTFIDHKGSCHNVNRKIMDLYCSYALSLIVMQRFDEAYEKLENAYKYAKNYDEANPGECEKRLLPALLYNLTSKDSIGIPHDPQLCNDMKFTGLISRVEADIAEM